MIDWHVLTDKFMMTPLKIIRLLSSVKTSLPETHLRPL